MTLEQRLSADLKTAMREKDEDTKNGIRSIKAAILLVKTDGTGTLIDEAKEVEILQKLAKQRQDSLDIYEKSNREDLAAVERAELAVIKRYRPEMLEGEQLAAVLKEIIAQTGASSMKDMGKVMGIASVQLKGKAEGRAISETVKKLLQ